MPANAARLFNHNKSSQKWGQQEDTRSASSTTAAVAGPDYYYRVLSVHLVILYLALMKLSKHFRLALMQLLKHLVCEMDTRIGYHKTQARDSLMSLHPQRFAKWNSAPRESSL